MAKEQQGITETTGQKGIQLPEIIVSDKTIRNLIFVVREQQVMLDSDLAALYQVETKVFNQAVKRNIARFPDAFRFQLTNEEYEGLRSQIVTSNGRGGRRYLPYVFTEQGIAMLSAVLNSNIAIQVSIQIMTAFVEMRRFLVNNSVMFRKISEVNWRQQEYEKRTDERFEKVFDYIAEHNEVKFTRCFHDRFLVIDGGCAYHIGASLKDAGKKCFAINIIVDEEVIKDILLRLSN